MINADEAERVRVTVRGDAKLGLWVVLEAESLGGPGVEGTALATFNEMVKEHSWLHGSLQTAYPTA